MNELVYPHERSLGTITLVLGILAWLLLILGTFGIALIGLAFGFLLYVFAQSALIAHIKGNGVELTAAQFPDLHAEFVACCDRLGMTERPQAYVLNGNGALNAFATRFLGTQYVVLLSDVVDAMSQRPDGLRFYIGHELGHIRMKHLTGHLLRWPVLWLPLLGAAYSRARETTCDRHGLACSGSPESAAGALAALSAGPQRWKDMDVEHYAAQASHSSEFWMSFHELVAGYPWLTKRVARVLDGTKPVPERNALAYVLAIFVPYAGRLGAGFGMVVVIYIVAMLAAIAIPAYQDYTGKAKLAAAVVETDVARIALAQRYLETRQIPASLAAVGLPEQVGDKRLSLDPEGMILTVTTPQGELIFVPSRNADGKIVWNCKGGKDIKPAQLPPACRASQ
jgi:Zn-dependent protease with chaperone function/type II secretory pathway pseudopilin PulG